MAFDPILFNEIQKLKKSIQDFKSVIQYQNIETITANDKITVDLSSNNIDGTKALIEILVKDDDNSSDTYNTYVNSEAIITKSLSTDGTTLEIYNYDNNDREVLIKIIQSA